VKLGSSITGNGKKPPVVVELVRGGNRDDADTFTCAVCGGTFDKSWSDEDAQREYDAIFEGWNEATVTVCEPCYRAMMVGMS
jgi:hypothetical protein